MHKCKHDQHMSQRCLACEELYGTQYRHEHYIEELESDNFKLRITIRDLKNRLDRSVRDLNKRIHDDFESVDLRDNR